MVPMISAGAHIIAVDIDRPEVWQRMIDAVRDSPATLTFPIREKFNGQRDEDLSSIAGCNLINQVCSDSEIE